MDIENTLTSKIITISDPYPIWVIDNFLKLDVIKKIKNEWPSLDSKVWHTGHKYINNKKNILEQGIHAINEYKDIPNYTAQVLQYIHSDKFTQKISSITNIKDLITDKSFRWSGLRTLTPGSFQAIHSDARKNPETGLRKKLTCLIYLNDGYIKERDGGVFEAWNDNMTQCIQEIEPLNNRLVIFLNSDTSYHGVTEVKSKRYAMLWSILKDEKLTDDRSKALFVSRPQDSKEIGELGKERAYIKDAIK